MRPKAILTSILLMLATFVGLVIFWFTQRPTPSQFPSKPTLAEGQNPYADLFIPPFRLTDSTNTVLDESIIDGQYTVIDFFYTSCPLICPGMSAAMKHIQDETVGTNLKLLSISIDPEVDTPEVIANYSQAFKADPDRWRFTTGDSDMISMLLMGVKFDLGKLDTEDGFRNIDHPTTLILLGPDRHVVKLYRYSDPDQIAELIKTAREFAG